MHSLALAAASALKPEDARSREAAIRALLRSNASGTLVRLLAYVGVLGALGLGAAHAIRSTPAIVEAEPARPVEWVQVAKPFPAFNLPMPELVDSAYDYAMRRHSTGGGRQDILTWGGVDADAPHLTVEIYRPAGELRRFGSAEREIAARLQGIGAGAWKPAGTMETKFGDVSLVEFSIKPARQCLGFVRAHTNPPLQILGWHCTRNTAPEPDFAACALDRLTLLAAGSEPKVRELFARAELKRTFCGQRSHLLAATPKLGPAAAAARARASAR